MLGWCLCRYLPRPAQSSEHTLFRCFTAFTPASEPGAIGARATPNPDRTRCRPALGALIGIGFLNAFAVNGTAFTLVDQAFTFWSLYEPPRDHGDLAGFASYKGAGAPAAPAAAYLDD